MAKIFRTQRIVRLVAIEAVAEAEVAVVIVVLRETRTNSNRTGSPTTRGKADTSSDHIHNNSSKPLVRPLLKRSIIEQRGERRGLL